MIRIVIWFLFIFWKLCSGSGFRHKACGKAERTRGGGDSTHPAPKTQTVLCKSRICFPPVIPTHPNEKFTHYPSQFCCWARVNPGWGEKNAFAVRMNSQLSLRMLCVVLWGASFTLVSISTTGALWHPLVQHTCFAPLEQMTFKAWVCDTLG